MARREKVVYLLGAGFSASLGLPLMANFLEKSKDMYADDPRSYSHFSKIFETIRGLSAIKNYYATDLFNIEDILSTLEMQEVLGSETPEKAFLRYIADVINYYTPSIERGVLPGNWEHFLFGAGPWRGYGYFVGSLLGLQFDRPENSANVYGTRASSNVSYSVVTLNYDLVLEKMCSFISQNYMYGSQISFLRELSEGSDDSPVLAKLHGSVDTGSIVPPTWSKGLADLSILSAWRAAHKLFTEANHIRVIGYSLPVADSYIKYLLRSSSVRSEHLKSMDVLCFDPDGSAESRYRDFISFKNFRFKNEKTEAYLLKLMESTLERYRYGPVRDLNLDRLEVAHEQVFS